MDVLKATSAYVTRMINHPTLTGMRVLILDDFTTVSDYTSVVLHLDDG